jgi:hypothetical protein
VNKEKWLRSFHRAVFARIVGYFGYSVDPQVKEIQRSASGKDA